MSFSPDTDIAELLARARGIAEQLADADAERLRRSVIRPLADVAVSSEPSSAPD